MPWDTPFLGPISVSVTAYFTAPTKWRKAEREFAMNNHTYAMVPVDGDNILKAVMDGMSKIVYLDDRCVVETQVIKRYSQEQGIRVCVKLIGDEDAGNGLDRPAHRAMAQRGEPQSGH